MTGGQELHRKGGRSLKLSHARARLGRGEERPESQTQPSCLSFFRSSLCFSRARALTKRLDSTFFSPLFALPLFLPSSFSSTTNRVILAWTFRPPPSRRLPRFLLAPLSRGERHPSRSQATKVLLPNGSAPRRDQSQQPSRRQTFKGGRPLRPARASRPALRSPLSVSSAAPCQPLSLSAARLLSRRAFKKRKRLLNHWRVSSLLLAFY